MSGIAATLEWGAYVSPGAV